MSPTILRFVLLSNVKNFPEFEVILGFECPNCQKIHYKTIREAAPLPTEMAWKLRCGVVRLVLPWQDELPVAGQHVPSITADGETRKVEV